MRLQVILKLALKNATRFKSCLDFGGGGGEFLPTLSKYFESVTLLDLNPERARKVVDHFELTNVDLVEENVFESKCDRGNFSVIVAADVLEHFTEPDKVITILDGMLAEDGVLITSLPSEGLTYIILRFILGVKKPDDHYFSADEIEVKLQNAGFKKVVGDYLPLKVKLFPLFSIAVWAPPSNEGR